MKSPVVITIPLYQTNLRDFEIASLKQCLSVLGDFPISFVVPKNLDLTDFVKTYKLEKCSFETFNDDFFTSVLGYNRLMLSEQFYKRFTEYKHLLIYQLDAYVFKNELLDWCLKDYDYIGAPWIASQPSFIKNIEKLFHSKKKKERSKIFFKVGNGGLSLRNVQKHAEIAFEMQEEIAQMLSSNKDDFTVMEDVFWSIKVPEVYPDFNIPFYKEALGFAIDRKPELAFKLNKNQLPFGCHGFEKPKVKSFWKTKIKY
jgi:hypothetical protein